MLIYTSNQRNKHTFNRFLSEFGTEQLNHAYLVWWLSAPNSVVTGGCEPADATTLVVPPEQRLDFHYFLPGQVL